MDWHAMIGYGQRADLDGWVSTWAQRLRDKIVQLEKEDEGFPEERVKQVKGTDIGIVMKELRGAKFLGPTMRD